MRSEETSLPRTQWIFKIRVATIRKNPLTFTIIIIGFLWLLVLVGPIILHKQVHLWESCCHQRDKKIIPKILTDLPMQKNDFNSARSTLVTHGAFLVLFLVLMTDYKSFLKYYKLYDPYERCRSFGICTGPWSECALRNPLRGKGRSSFGLATITKFVKTISEQPILQITIQRASIKNRSEP